MAVTLRDVAAAAGVSTATASRVLSGGRAVSPAIAQEVRLASERLGYRTNVLARSLRTQTTGTVGMVVPRISNPFFPAIVEVVEWELSESGRQLLLCDSQGSTDIELARVNALIGRRVDGMLLIACRSTASVGALGQALLQMPVVQIDRHVDGLDGDSVRVDNDHGISTVIDHLRATGCRTFAFVSARPEDSSALERLTAYRRLTAQDPGSADRVLLADFSLEWGQAATQTLMSGGLPDAIVCGADIVAIGVLAALGAAGIDVPGDVSVTGYDDIGLAAVSSPPLTTVRQPTQQMGTQSVQLLIDRLAGREGRPEHRVLQPQLIVRATTGSSSSRSAAPP